MQLFSRTSFIFEGGLAATVCGSILLFIISSMSFDVVSNLPAPWMFSTLIYLPLVGAFITLRVTIDNLNGETEGLKQTEVSRLRGIISRRRSQLTGAIFYCIISAMLSGAIIWLLFKNPDFYRGSSFLIGAGIGFGLYLLAWLLHELKGISEFKAVLNDKKRKREE